MGEIDKIIAAICPDKYHDGTLRQIAKLKRLKKTQGLDKAIKEAKEKPAAQYVLTYDSTTETLEPIYFWILDFMNQVSGGDVEKLVDNFASSPGSGHFSELQGKASQMQQEASRVLGTVNNILKGVLNLIYDLKEFKIRLSHYEEANSKDKSKAEAGLIALKQIWMDKVDIQRGAGSINAMASGNLQFVTLRDAFMIVNSVKDVDKLDLNDRVRRVLKPRVQEFFEWRKRSEQELRKRFEIEKIYLKSQVNALKLNSRWAKPYLKAAEQLRSNDKLATDASLVNIFNTVLLELTLMGKSPVKVENEVMNKHLPEEFKNMKKLRKYYSVLFIDFNFRGVPSKAGQHYVFGGRADVTFKAYSLNEDEIALLKYKLSDSDLNSSLKLVQGMTDDSLQQLKIDLDEFLEDEEPEKKSSDANPFISLFSFFKPAKKESKKEDEKQKEKIKEANYAERYVRNLAEANAMNTCFAIYDVYKKGHGMASIPYGGGDAEVEAPQTAVERFFGM